MEESKNTTYPGYVDYVCVSVCSRSASQAVQQRCGGIYRDSRRLLSAAAAAAKNVIIHLRALCRVRRLRFI